METSLSCIIAREALWHLLCRTLQKFLRISRGSLTVLFSRMSTDQVRHTGYCLFFGSAVAH